SRRPARRHPVRATADFETRRALLAAPLHHLDGSFRGWYVNLEQPQQRTTLGFDFEDELLDIWVEQDSDPEWLDEDEPEEAVRRGVFPPERTARIRTNGQPVPLR